MWKRLLPPTVENEGYTLHKCTECGDEYKSDFVEPHKHKYTETVIAPTLNSEGYTLHKCTGCGDEYKSNTTAKLTCQSVLISYIKKHGILETSDSDTYYTVIKNLPYEQDTDGVLEPSIAIFYYENSNNIMVSYISNYTSTSGNTLLQILTIDFTEVKEYYTFAISIVSTPPYDYSAIGAGLINGKSIYYTSRASLIKFEQSPQALTKDHVEESAAINIRSLCFAFDAELKNIDPNLNLSYWGIIYK